MHTFDIYKERFEILNEQIPTARERRNMPLYHSLAKEQAFLSKIVSIVNQIERDHAEALNYIGYSRNSGGEEKELFVQEAREIRGRIKTARLELNEIINTMPKQESSESTERNENDEDYEDELDEDDNSGESQVNGYEAKPKSKKKKNNFSDKVKKIRGKEWDLIKDNLIDNVPIVEEAGKVPTEKMEELSELSSIFQLIRSREKLAGDSNVNVVFDSEISQVARQMSFAEGIFLLHKATHILSAAEIHSDQGLISWSLSSAYQSAFLAAKSILRLLGITAIPFENETYIVDVWREYNSTSGKISAGIIRFNKKVEQRHIWVLFMRIINSYRIPVWRKKTIDIIKSLDEKDFGKQRNHLHYWTGSWIFDDLHSFLINPTFGVYPQGLEKGLENYSLKSDFSLVLAQLIIGLAINLLEDLNKHTNAVKAETDLLNRQLRNFDRHPIYIKNMI